MEVLLVIAFVLLSMRIVGLVALVLVDRDRHHRPATSSTDPCLAPVWAIPPATAADPEQELLRRLQSGEIGREQYRAAIAGIARGHAAGDPLRMQAR